VNNAALVWRLWQPGNSASRPLLRNAEQKSDDPTIAGKISAVRKNRESCLFTTNKQETLQLQEAKSITVSA
jgi:hypothetical protein